MAMATSDLNQRYVGEVIILVTFEIPNGPTLRFTPSSASNIVCHGQTYLPMPMSASGFGSTSGQFKDASLSVSNIDKTFMTYLQNYDDMKDVKVTFYQTFSKYLTNASKMMNYATYTISQTSFSAEQIDFTLTHPMNQEGTHLPAKQMTRNEYPSIGKYK